MPKFRPDNLNIRELAVEEPEKEKREGRDPKTFLNEVFKWVEKNNKGASTRENWFISLSENFVDMGYKADELPKKYIDETLDVTEDFGQSFFGIDKLLEILDNVRVISIKGQNNIWYLKIIEDKPKKESLQTETPQIPKQKQF